ncbi:MAG: right-handed parallel beta-helix repeat-containing protein [Prevotella sp.]|nr:right-handed parallel beta-helix repeat-containing protein [Prevotella sp.]
MTKRIFFFLSLIAILIGCSDDDSFTTSRDAKLTFSVDTVRLDTVFSNVGSSTYSFWAYNYASDGIRISKVSLRQGNQTGFRVNVDGDYLDNSLGSTITDLEVRKGDSIRVFVELTASPNKKDAAQLLSDDIVFQLESGVEQKMNLKAYTWDAVAIRDLVISSDTLITSSSPIVVYGGITVNEGSTLILKNVDLYFHDKAGVQVKGTLVTDSVLMRGDRLDHMFSYLPYDRVSGQWEGIRFYGSSEGNIMHATELRNGMYGIRCDSSLVSADHQRLYMERCVIHNCKGIGMELFHSYVGMLNCQLTNSLGDCMMIYGGAMNIQNCTIAQFYPFSANRGVAFRFVNGYGKYDYPLVQLLCKNSIITGYADDELFGTQTKENAAFEYQFENCLIRTPAVNDTVRFKNIIFERPTDEIQGKKHFVLIDEKNMKYDFHLDSLSTAKGMGCY